MRPAVHPRPAAVDGHPCLATVDGGTRAPAYVSPAELSDAAFCLACKQGEDFVNKEPPGCLAWCSTAGYCGHTAAYQHVRCRPPGYGSHCNGDCKFAPGWRGEEKHCVPASEKPTNPNEWQRVWGNSAPEFVRSRTCAVEAERAEACERCGSFWGVLQTRAPTIPGLPGWMRPLRCGAPHDCRERAVRAADARAAAETRHVRRSSCVPSAAEAAFKLLGVTTCAAVQDAYDTCLRTTDRHHALMLANCPCTCKKARWVHSLCNAHDRKKLGVLATPSYTVQSSATVL